MMQYLVVLLDDTSVSYCHCDNPYNRRRLISLEDLKAGVIYAMKQNLMIQFVYPDYELPQEYLDVINTIDHHDIKPAGTGIADVTVIDSAEQVPATIESNIYVLRLNKAALFANGEKITDFARRVKRLTVVIKDIDTFTDEDLSRYNALLDQWIAVLSEEYANGHELCLNLLTDRIMLNRPNHCNAGVENITLAPNGRYYICPAFYYSDPEDSIDPQNIPNRQLLQLEYAPLCRCCDAYNCRRCVWLNQKTTLEVNTPSHEQCVVAHTERNASQRLLASVRRFREFMPNLEIREITYLDPFDVCKER